MYGDRSKPPLGGWLVLAGLLVVLTAKPLSAGKPPPPAERTYFTIFMGLTGPHSLDAGCVEFTGDQICVFGNCGEWRPRKNQKRKDKETAFRFDFELSPPFGGGIGAFVHGHGRVDRNGSKNAIGAAAMAQPNSLLAGPDNISFAGRQASLVRCQRLVDEFEAD